ncbi:hypothetical protein [Novosphingobium fuchskuhlense]|uniref:hypothetical protein n=1 Tax=Novosphingobium fuchskuhlense TaxID=1117702 RepID=UPI000B0F7D18|nr:hypothetical protein [Novosphingobium fuchskuhlense]
MMRLFRRRPTASDAGRTLSELRCLGDRERYRAKARLMRSDMGLPPLPELEPRG